MTKPALKVVSSSQPLPSLAEAKEALDACERAIAVQERERNAARTELHAALKGVEAGDARELRGAVVDLEAALELLQEKRGVLQAELADAKRREAVAAKQRARQASIDKAQRMRAAVLEIQQSVDKLADLVGRFPELDVEWCRSLTDQPQGFEPYAFTKILNRLIGLRIHMLTNGKVRAPGVIESPWQLEQEKRADLLHHLRNYVEPALRGALPEPSPPEPPKAA